MKDTYQSSLDLKTFGSLLNRRYITNSHKYYWFIAIVNTVCRNEETLTFNALVDEMIIDAWYTVLEYHVHLGPMMIDPKSGKKKATDAIEQAIYWIKDNTSLSEKSKRIEVEEGLTKLIGNKEYLNIKRKIIRYAPNKFLSPYFSVEETVEKYESGKKKEKSDGEYYKILQIENEKRLLPYTIKWKNSKLEREIVVPKQWREYFSQNRVEITGWIEREKVEYLQDRNPEVPGIIYKLRKEESRDLSQVRALWDAILSSGIEIKDIFSDETIRIDDYEVDHFIPWTYIANNELWNLCPIKSSVNLDKSNSIAPKKYIKNFVNIQSILFITLQKECEKCSNNTEYESEILTAFKKCKKDHLFAQWASDELFNLQGGFNAKLLKKHITQLREAALTQGFAEWKMNKTCW